MLKAWGWPFFLFMKYIVFNKTSNSIIHSNRATLVKEKLDIDIKGCKC